LPGVEPGTLSQRSGYVIPPLEWSEVSHFYDILIIFKEHWNVLNFYLRIFLLIYKTFLNLPFKLEGEG
jgi:hypothetical protein